MYNQIGYQLQMLLPKRFGAYQSNMTLTKFLDANLLQVLPSDVGDVLDVVVALAGQRLMVHAQPQ